MKRKTEKRPIKDDLRAEYDFAVLKLGTRGKYLVRYRTGTNLVLLSPDVAAFFPDDRSVNAAPRYLIQKQKVPLSAARRNNFR